MAEKEASQQQQAGRIIDARGRRVSQLDPVIMHILHRPDTIPVDVLRGMAQQVGLGVTRATRTAFWASIAGLICLGIALIICTTKLTGGSISTGRFFRNLVPYVGVLGGSITTWISLRSARHQRIGKVMLKHFRCPHCGYDLRLLPTAPEDGATVCPECGCAWMLVPRAQDDGL